MESKVYLPRAFMNSDADHKPLAREDKMTNHLLAPLLKAPTDRKNAAVRLGPPNSTSSSPRLEDVSRMKM